MKIQIGDAKVKIEDIFKQDLLSKLNPSKANNRNLIAYFSDDIINETVNKNLRLFTKELMPIIEKNLAEVFLDIGNRIVEDYTYNQLFPI